MMDSASANGRVGMVKAISTATIALATPSPMNSVGVVTPPSPCSSATTSVATVMNSALRMLTAATTRAQRSAALVYGDAVWDEARFIAFAERIGYLYVNDHSMYLTGQGRYPWNYLPTNLAYQVELVQRSKW